MKTKLVSIIFAATVGLTIAAPARADVAAGAPAGSTCNSGHWYGTSFLRDGKWVCLTTSKVGAKTDAGAEKKRIADPGAAATKNKN